MTTPTRVETGPLRHAIEALVAEGVIPHSAPALDATMSAAGSALRAAVLAEVPAFAASANPEILPGLREHAIEHMTEIRRLMAGGAVGDFAFVGAQAQMRADQRFPLEATLHAYRCGHRALAIWMREAALACNPPRIERAISAVADFAIEYTNAISSVATSEYVAQTRLLAQAEGDLRIELLNVLLSGYDESDARLALLLRRAGFLEQHRSYCVVVAQSVNAAEMGSLVRAQRVVASLTDAIVGAHVRTLGGVRDGVAVVVCSDRRRQSGWTAPQAGFAERLREMLLVVGPAILVGVSLDRPSTAFVPKALHEAKLALEFASVTQRIINFGQLSLRALLVRRGAAEVYATPPAWAQALIEAQAASPDTLATLKAIADADLNIQSAARAMGRHANTIYARITRLRQKTGLDARRFHDLVELLLAAECWLK